MSAPSNPQKIDASVRFLQAVVRDPRITMVVIPVEGGTTKARTFDRSDVNGLRKFLGEYEGHFNIHFQVNPLRADVANKKAKKEHIARAELLHVDIDRLDGLELLRNFLPLPTVVVFSGGGYHAYWLLDTPSTEFKLVEELNSALARTVGGDTSAIDVSRILRVPYTTNLPNKKKRKLGRKPVDSHVVDELTDFTRQYSIEELASALAESVQLRDNPTRSTVPAQSVELDEDGLPVGLSDFDKLLAIDGPVVGPGGYNSRSEGVWRFLCQCARLHVPLTVSAGIIANRRFGISESILEKQRPSGYALRQAERAWEAVHSDFERTSQGVVRPTLRNTLLAISKLGIECWYDTFKRRRYIQGCAVKDLAGKVTDDAEIGLRTLILREFGFDPTAQHVHDAVRALALENTRNTMAEYFNGLEWDGKRRLDGFLVDYCGAEDTPFNRSIASKAFMAAVRRSRHPGTKFDTVMVIEGPQGCGKSSMLAILAGPANFSDQSILSVEPRAQMELVEGVLIFEIAELEGLTKTEATKVKAFLSRTEDRGRVAYGRNRDEQPRTCIFVGTTNESHYLKDTTGNRRFWPVKVGQIDLQAVECDRDQLWAEAASREADGEHITLEPALYAAAAEAQEERLEADPWEDALRNVPGDRFGTEYRIATNTVFGHLELTPSHQKGSDAKRVAAVMRRLGWFGPKPMRFGGSDKPQKGFWRPA